MELESATAPSGVSFCTLVETNKMRSNCGAAISAARTASEVLPMPPGPSMSAPQVRVCGSKALAIESSSCCRPKNEARRGRLLVVGVGIGSAGGTAGAELHSHYQQP